MSNALLVAQLLGPIYLTIAIGMFVSQDYYKKMYEEMLKSRMMMYVGGIMAFLIGLLILRVHNVWTADWTVVVTIIGWLALLKGVCLLVIPQKFLGWNAWVKNAKGLLVAEILAFLLGIGLTYVGYFM